MLLSAKFLPSFLKNTKLSVQEIILTVIFIIYIISPIGSPRFISTMVESPLGLISIFAITVFLFVYTNPILGILYLLVAYELIRRSDRVSSVTSISPSMRLPEPARALSTPNMTASSQYVTPTIGNLPDSYSLEEEMVSSMSPIGEGKIKEIVDTSFKPTIGNIHNASYT
jgi:hypothetical protein